MSRHEVTLKKVLYEIAGMDRVSVRRDIEFRTTAAGPLTLDVYRPPDAPAGSLLPAVVFLIGFSDVGARKYLGCAAKEMESFISWAKLVAASGLVAITHTTGTDPATDTPAAFDYVVQNAASLGVDAKHVGIWACSGHGPTALSVLMRGGAARPKCAALLYPYTIDLDGRTDVADAQKAWGFANPAAGKTAGDLPMNVPLFIIRAGLDQFAGLNVALDRLVAAALDRNLPLTLVNYATGSHAFDVSDHSEDAREIVRQTLAFLVQTTRPG